MPPHADLLHLPAPEGARRLARRQLAAAVAATIAPDAPDAVPLRAAVRALARTLRSCRPLLADTVPRGRAGQLAAALRGGDAAHELGLLAPALDAELSHYRLRVSLDLRHPPPTLAAWTARLLRARADRAAEAPGARRRLYAAIALATQLVALPPTGRATRRLRALARALADRLEAEGAPDVEIERKYLLRALPDAVRGAAWDELWQGYLPGERLVERVRRVRSPDGAESYFRTVKGGRSVHRIEIEEETTLDVFDALWALTAGRRVHKRRYRVRDGARTWEVDEFLDRELHLAEIELAAADEPVTFPAWLAPFVERDVTEDGRYGNRTLAM